MLGSTPGPGVGLGGSPSPFSGEAAGNHTRGRVCSPESRVSMLFLMRLPWLDPALEVIRGTHHDVEGKVCHEVSQRTERFANRGGVGGPAPHSASTV